MDRRILAALTILAGAAEAAPSLAAELRNAPAQGTAPVTRDSVLRSAYNVALSPNGGKVASAAFMKVGYSQAEADQMSLIAKSIAMKSGSYANFQMALEGRVPNGVMLNAREMALLRTISSLNPGDNTAKMKKTAWDGYTWDGHGAISAKPVVLDGHVARPVLTDSTLAHPNASAKVKTPR